MPTLKDVRSAYPEYNDWSDEALSDALYKRYGQSSGMEKPDYDLALQGRGPRMSPLESGIANLKSSFKTTKAGVAHAVGADEAARNYLKEAQDIEEDVRARYQPEVPSYEDIDSPYKLGRYVYEKFGESAPQMGAQIAGGLLGGGIGGVAARGLLGSLAARGAVAIGSEGAMLAGSTAAGLPLYTGSNLQRQMEEGTPFEETSLTKAVGAGVAQSALDSLSLATVFKGIPGTNLSTKTSIFTQAVIRGVESGATEALTETAQQALEIIQANPEKLFEFGPEVQKELKEAAVAGALLGGAMGGTSGAIQAKFGKGPETGEKPPRPEPVPPQPEPEPEPKPPGPEPKPPGPEPVPPGPEPKPPGPEPVPPGPEPTPVSEQLAPRSFGSEELTEPSRQGTDPLTGKPIVRVDLPENQSVNVQFDNDFDRALHLATAEDINEKTRQEYVDFLKYQGLDEAQIKDLGSKLDAKIQEEGRAKVESGDTSPLTIDFARREASDVYNNLPQIAKTWESLKQQGFSAQQVNETMSGKTAHETAVRGPVSEGIQQESGFHYYAGTLPQVDSKVGKKPTAFLKNKINAMVPGFTNVMENIVQRLFPGTDVHFYNTSNSSIYGSFGGIWRYKTAANARRPGSFAVALNMNALFGKKGMQSNLSTEEGRFNFIHTTFHELSHPTVDAVLTRLNAADMEAVLEQYRLDRNSAAARRSAAGWAFSKYMSDPRESGVTDPAKVKELKERIAKKFGVSETALDEFIKNPDTDSLGTYFEKNSLDTKYRRDFQEWAAEKGMRWMLEEVPGRVPETVMGKFARDVMLALREVYRAIEAALGIPYTPGAFEHAMADAWGKHDKINVNKALAEKMILDPRNTQRYTSAELRDVNTKASSPEGLKTTENIPVRPPVETTEEVATKTGTATQLPTSGTVREITDKLRKEREVPQSGFQKFMAAVKDVWKNGSWKDLGDTITETIADNMIKVLRLDERYAAEMKRQGRTLEAAYDERYPMTARLSAYAAALGRENSLAMVETMLHHGGRVEFVKSGKEATDGYLRVSRDGKGGVPSGLTFLGDLTRSGKLDQWRDYAMAKRIEGLAERGLKTPITVNEARKVIAEYAKDPQIVKAYDQYQEFNRNLMKMAADSGVITREQADIFMKNNDYYPFYRELEEGKGFSGPIFTAGIISPTRIAQALGGTEHLKNDPAEVILKNAHFWVNAAAKNVASNKIYTMMKAIGEASDLPKTGGKIGLGELEGTTRINGKEQRFVIRNPDLAAALESMSATPMPNWTKFLGAFTGTYRELVTRDPTFIIKNLLRDPFSAMVTSGVKFNPFKAFGNFVEALRNPAKMESLQALQNFGILGGYRSLPDMQSAKHLLGKGFDPKAVQSGSYFVVPDANTLTGVISKAWNALGHMAEASDAATRTAIYQEVLAKTGSEAEAAFRAQEVMNFRKHGSSQLIRYISMMVPFVNGRIQGLSAAATAFKPENLGYTMMRGGMLFGVSMALQGLTADDKDYEQLPDYVRQGALNVPLKYLGIADKGFLSIPKPFEMGFIFQTVPELMIQAYGLDTKEDRAVREVLYNYVAQTLGFNPIPAVVSPLAEVYFNRSVMTGLPLVTQSMQQLPPELQFTANTSDLMKSLGQVTGMSPVKLEAIVKGYGGQVITTMLGMVDGMYRAASGKGTEKDFTQYQPVSTFIKNDRNTNPQGVADIYRLSAEIQGLTTGFQNYLSYGMVDEAKKLMDDNQGLFMVKGSITALRNQLNNLSRQERIVMNNENISQEARTQYVNSLRDARRQISSIMPDLIKYTGK